MAAVHAAMLANFWDRAEGIVSHNLQGAIFDYLRLERCQKKADPSSCIMTGFLHIPSVPPASRVGNKMVVQIEGTSRGGWHPGWSILIPLDAGLSDVFRLYTSRRKEGAPTGRHTFTASFLGVCIWVPYCTSYQGNSKDDLFHPFPQVYTKSMHYAPLQEAQFYELCIVGWTFTSSHCSITLIALIWILSSVVILLAVWYSSKQAGFLVPCYHLTGNAQINIGSISEIILSNSLD
ncbi:hypothetical protein HPP92_028975 [Vanilla planifolia]|uniref:Uncharacterized protein n=1 Tax=Vanilla planifolia TaxID=51239 RepID=A0A835P5E2_VANPL|nr:hypothetical protein HPP92_028975 [Vanilla planifolia]KAG0446175.1 hypothetical protein HPP92_028964 [Vanilla planifolia]